MLLARLFHHLIAHPLVGFFELISLGRWKPRWVEDLHDVSADAAFGPDGPPKPYECIDRLVELPPDYAVVVAIRNVADPDAGDDDVWTYSPEGKAENILRCVKDILDDWEQDQ